MELCDKCDIILSDEEADIKHNFYKNTKSIYNFRNLKNNINNKFTPIAKIPNKFNRCVYFDSSLHHRAQTFFGTSIENSRLTLASFFF